MVIFCGMSERDRIWLNITEDQWLTKISGNFLPPVSGAILRNGFSKGRFIICNRIKGFISLHP